MPRWLLLVAACAACGTPPPQWSPDAGACVAYDVPASTDLTTPTSFKTDVMPILNQSCGTGTCHGASSDPTGGLFLGASTAHGADAATVYSTIVGKASNEMQALNLVEPTNPEMSYLMHKMDGDQCQFDSMCVGMDCQRLMPSGDGAPLPVATRDTVRRWIAQGAQNN